MRLFDRMVVYVMLKSKCQMLGAIPQVNEIADVQPLFFFLLQSALVDKCLTYRKAMYSYKLGQVSNVMKK
mgnify:CR=1 FL=1